MVPKVITFFMDQADFETFQNFSNVLNPIMRHRANCLHSTVFLPAPLSYKYERVSFAELEINLKPF